MKIGIDIDDTITDTWEYIIPVYSQLFNQKGIKLFLSLLEEKCIMMNIKFQLII